MARGVAVLVGGQVVGQAFSLIRNIIIARVLSPSDFGIAALFAITVSFLEMIGYMALDRLIVQAEDGDSSEMQATIQSFQVGRGLVLGALLLLIAWPVTAFFKVPDARVAFQWLALVPVLRGFLHLDVIRLHRTLVFGPSVAVNAMPKLLSAVAAWPIAVVIGDYTAVLWLLIGQTTLTTVMSHAVAKRPYQLGWDRAIVDRMVQFGWPVLLNSLLMFCIMQGDGVIIGHSYTKAELGVYMAALMLMVQPAAMVSAVASSLFLPVLSQVQNDKRRFWGRVSSAAQWISVASMMIILPLMTFGAVVVSLLYGEEYSAAQSFVVYLAAISGIRILRIAPTTGAVARADTVTPMVSNIARSLSIVLAVICAFMHGPLWWIAASGIAGELLAYSIAVWRVNRLHGVPIAVFALSGGSALVLMAATGGIMSFDVVRLDPANSLLVFMGAVSAGCLVVLVGFSDVRAVLGNAWRWHSRKEQGSVLAFPTRGQIHNGSVTKSSGGSGT